MKKNLCSIDLHMHSTVSDGTDSPELLLEKVRRAGIVCFSVTDHDALKAAETIRPLLCDDDLFFIPGVEFSCRDKNGKYHILGYGFDPEDAGVQSVVQRGHDLRMKKVEARLSFLRSEYGFSFPEEEIARLLSQDNPGKPHIGNLMVKYGYAQTKEEAIERFINRFSPGGYLSPEEAISGILASGGVPVLAHPFFGSGDELILGEEMEELLRRLMEYGLRGLEAYYSGFSEKLRREALSLADRYHLLITAGSDYHGANKLVQLGDTGFDGEEEYPEGLRRFLSLFGR